MNLLTVNYFLMRNVLFSFEYDTGIYQKLGFFMYDDLIKDEEIGKLFKKGEKILEIKNIDLEKIWNFLINVGDKTEESKVLKKLETKLGEEIVSNLSEYNQKPDELLEYIGENVKLSYEEKKKHLWLYSNKLKSIMTNKSSSVSKSGFSMRKVKSVAKSLLQKKESKYDKLVRFILEENKGKIHLNELIKIIDTESNHKIKNYVLLFCRSADILGPKDRRPSGQINNVLSYLFPLQICLVWS